MNRFISIPTILRMVPKSLLQQFFGKLGFPALPVDWAHLRSGEIRPILDAISRVGTNEQMAIENALYDVSNLACSSGITALREAGNDVFCIRPPDDDLGWVMCIWLQHPEVFSRATLLQQVDHIEQWHRRVGLPCVNPRTSDRISKDLGGAISDLLYREQDGR
jgi:hypothetical protein